MGRGQIRVHPCRFVVLFGSQFEVSGSLRFDSLVVDEDRSTGAGHCGPLVRRLLVTLGRKEDILNHPRLSRNRVDRRHDGLVALLFELDDIGGRGVGKRDNELPLFVGRFLGLEAIQARADCGDLDALDRVPGLVFDLAGNPAAGLCRGVVGDGDQCNHAQDENDAPIDCPHRTLLDGKQIARTGPGPAAARRT